MASVPDDRLAQFDRKLEVVSADVRAIRDMLSEPAASPSGRNLQRQHDELEAEFDSFIRDRFMPVEKWWHEQRGVWKAIAGTGIVLGMIGTFFGIASWFGFNGGP